MTIILVKQFILSILEGTIPFFILYHFEKNNSPSIIVESMLANDNIQVYLTIIGIVYIFLWTIDRYILIPSSVLATTIIFLKDIFNQVASSIKSILRIFIGIIIGFLIIWKKVEPQSLSLGRVLVLLFFAVIFLFIVSKLEQIHTMMENRPN